MAKKEINPESFRDETNQIQFILKQQGKDKQWLAKELEIDETIVGDWCENNSQPSFIHLFKAAKILNKEPKNLYL